MNKKFNIKEWKDTHFKESVNEGNDIDKLILKMNPGSTIKIDGKIRTKDKFGNWRHEDDENDILVNRDIVKITNDKNMKVHKSGSFHIIESVNEAPSVNDQAIKEFANLHTTLLRDGGGIVKAISDLQPVPAKSLRNQIVFLHKQLIKLTK